MNIRKNISKKTGKNESEGSTGAPFQYWTAPPEPITGASLLPPRHLPCKMTAGLLKGDCSAVNAHRTTIAEKKYRSIIAHFYHKLCTTISFNICRNPRNYLISLPFTSNAVS